MNPLFDFFKTLDHSCFFPFLILALIGLIVCIFCQKYELYFPIAAMWTVFLFGLFLWLTITRIVFLRINSYRYMILVTVPVFFIGAAGLTAIRRIRYGKIIVWGILIFFLFISFYKISRIQGDKERENTLIQCCMEVKKFQDTHVDKVIGLACYSKYGHFLQIISEKLNLKAHFWPIVELDKTERFFSEFYEIENKCDGLCLFVSAADEPALQALWKQNNEWGEWQTLYQTRWGNMYYIPNLSPQFGVICQPSDAQPYEGEKILAFYPGKESYPPNEKETWREAFKKKGLPTTGVTQLPGIFYLNASRASEKNTANLKIQMVEGVAGEPDFLSLSSPDFVSFLFYRDSITVNSEIHFRLIFSGQPDAFVILKGYGYKNGIFVPLQDFATFRCVRENEWRLGEKTILDLDQQCDKIVFFLEFFGEEIRVQMLEVF